MIDTWHLPKPRILVGIGLTVAAVVVLGVTSFAGSDDGDEGGTTTVDPIESSVSPETTPPTSPAIDESTTSTSIVLAPDWYPKQSSRFSDRRPVVTVTTLPPAADED